MKARNWKTTLLGILAGVLMLGHNIVQDRVNGGAPITIGNTLPAVAVALLGIATKDHDK